MQARRLHFLFGLSGTLRSAGYVGYCNYTTNVFNNFIYILAVMELRLKELRHTLYVKFDEIKSHSDFYNFQVDLTHAIMESERNIMSNYYKDVYQFHLDRLYALGDALVWTVLDEFVIRQLGRYEAVRTSLINQEAIFLKLLADYKVKAETSIYIFADLTRCITIGDVVEVHGHDSIRILESKTTKPASISELLSGRNGRQFSKTHWLSRFLQNGFEKLYRENKPTKAIVVNVQPTYNFAIIPELIDRCLEDDTAYVQTNDGVVYIAQNLDAEENKEVICNIGRINWQQPILAGTGRLIENDTETRYHMPAMAFPIPLKYKILIHEVDININGVLDVKHIINLAEKQGYLFSFDEEDRPTLSKDGVNFKFHVRFINNVLINFWTIQSLVDTLIALFEQMILIDGKLTDEEQLYLNSRPNTLAEFKEHLQENHVQVLFDGNNNVIKAYKMNGEEINLEEFMAELNTDSNKK